MKTNILWFLYGVGLIIFVSSCSKDKTKPVTTNTNTLGLYEYGVDSGKRAFIPVSKIGTQTVNYYSVFDTGSSGMTIDAHGIIPDAMITTTGISFTGDSTTVNGITIIAGQYTLSYGNKTGLTKEYGYLAYAPLTIGDANGSMSSKRVPIFLYYKVVDVTTGNTETVNHALDIFGVGPGSSYANSSIVSPLIYFNNSASVVSGFKLAVLPRNMFSSSGTYVSKLLTVGLSSADVTSNGFIMHPLTYGSVGGYSANIPATITYSNQTISANVLFDTGTPLFSTIENKLALMSTGPLPASTQVTVTTNMGFTYTYTTTTATNLTQVENPNVTGDYRTIFGIDFFMNNEYLTDYMHHQIGLKNN
ncbi:MAG: hypothetical protein JST50_06320 [Bacteroidetes bacterium]|jgi:hypothetical protein|nr:hypothetical protein [Bacteroidota bacterium]